jgi:Fic family protein
MLEKKLDFTFAETQKILKRVAEIDRFKGKWEQAVSKESRHLKELRKLATLQSIGSSTRIEGSKLTDPEVDTLLRNIKITKFRSRDEAEVVGYYETLETVLENYRDIPLEESRIFQLHGMLLKHSTKDESHRGRYKSLSNSVTATYPGGVQRVLFETTPPHLVRKEMENLLQWAGGQIKQREIHPLLVICVFVYEFLSIHPFQDGNGRLSRILTTLLLLGTEYDFIQYVSFEHQIEKGKKDYYRALMNCQKQRAIGKFEKIYKWCEYFLDSLLESTRNLEEKLGEEKQIIGYLNERRKIILKFMTSNPVVKISDIRKKFPKLNGNTLKKDLQILVAEKYLEKIGEKRGSVYHLTALGRKNGSNK